MPVLAFTGLPGHGKSYGVVANVILPALLSGRTVVTNIPMRREALRAKLTAAGCRGPLKLLSIDVETFANGTHTFAENIPDGAVVVLDELWRLWPAGLKANNASDDHKSFLAEHRHRVGTDGKTIEIILVTQDLSQISAFARVLVERTYVVHKLKEVGSNDRYVVTIWAGVRMGERGGQQIGKSGGKYDPEVFELYQSHTKSDTVGMEIEADSRGTVWSSALVRYGLPAAVLCSLVGVWQLLDIFQGYRAALDVDAQAAEPAPKRFAQHVEAPEVVIAGVVRTSEQRLTPEFQLSQIWRIAGTIEMDGVGFAYLVADSGYRYLPLSECAQLSDIQVQYECHVDGERVTSWTGARRSRNLLTSD
jgi:zona occludens toxin